MVGVGGKRACTLGMQSLYWGFISFHILMVFASFLRVNRSINFISFDDGEHTGHDFST